VVDLLPNGSVAIDAGPQPDFRSRFVGGLDQHLQIAGADDIDTDAPRNGRLV
jgi:hypothetical protein